MSTRWAMTGGPQKAEQRNPGGEVDGDATGSAGRSIEKRRVSRTGDGVGLSLLLLQTIG